VNQIGTLTETLEAMQMADERALHECRVRTAQVRLKTPSSRISPWPRAREDQDRFASRTDRIAKYNQLLRIEEELGDARNSPAESVPSVMQGKKKPLLLTILDGWDFRLPPKAMPSRPRASRPRFAAS